MQRRTLVFFGLTGAALGLSGCGASSLRSSRADGTYCFRATSRSRSQTCTPEPIPDIAVDLQARDFQADANALTLYVMRKRWADVSNVIALWVDGERLASTVPASYVRAKLNPGAHRLSMRWRGGVIELPIDGAAGVVVFVEIVGSSWFWGSNYSLEPGNLESTRDRLQSSRLIADRNLVS